MADFYHELTNYRDLLAKKIERAHAFLLDAPDGYLACNCCKGKVTYQRKEYGPLENKRVCYISKKDNKLLHALAQKRYYQQLLPIMEKEKSILDKLSLELSACKKERCYSDVNINRKCLITPDFCLPEDYEESWTSAAFSQKEIDENVMTIKTKNGELVRSKSEKIIADELFLNDIPYRYEAELDLHGIRIHPDFTILNKRTGKVYYLEHLGMMDNDDYYNSVIRRLDLYAQNELFVGDKILITYESSHRAINTAQLDFLIEEYLI